MNMTLFLYILVMAGVTYAVRMLPLVIFRKKIKSEFVQSLLYYVPYSVLGAMTIPAIFYSTGSVWSAVAGFAVAVILAFRDRPLIIIALAACAAAYATEWILTIIS